VRGTGGRDDEQAIELQRLVDVLGDHQVTDVRRIERPAEDAEAGHGAQEVPGGSTSRSRRAGSESACSSSSLRRTSLASRSNPSSR